MRAILIVGTVVIALGRVGAAAGQPPPGKRVVGYQRDVQPMLAQTCYACHGPTKFSGGLRVDSVAALLEGGRSGPAVVAGKSSESLLVKKSDENDPTPHKGRVLTPEQTAVLKAWIDQGLATAERRLTGVVEVDLSKLPPDLARAIMDALTSNPTDRPK